MGRISGRQLCCCCDAKALQEKSFLIVDTVVQGLVSRNLYIYPSTEGIMDERLMLVGL